MRPLRVPAGLVRRVNDLLRQAARAGTPEPTAVTLATRGPGGQVAGRVVLMKRFDARGAMFFTNLRSRKARHLARHPQAALIWHSQRLSRQILLEGRVTRASAAEADAYWRTRPRDSQLGAWASAQSQPMQSRAALLRRWRAYQRQFKGHPVPRPPHWGGFRLQPTRLEFWRAQPHRLHERIVYKRQAGRWRRQLLGP